MGDSPVECIIRLKCELTAAEQENERLLQASRYNSDVAEQALLARKEALEDNERLRKRVEELEISNRDGQRLINELNHYLSDERQRVAGEIAEFLEGTCANPPSVAAEDIRRKFLKG